MPARASNGKVEPSELISHPGQYVYARLTMNSDRAMTFPSRRILIPLFWELPQASSIAAAWATYNILLAKGGDWTAFAIHFGGAFIFLIFFTVALDRVTR